MNKYIVDEKTGIPYTLVGDYYLPWGDLPNDELERHPIGIWGQRHYTYLKKKSSTAVNVMRMNGTLERYLRDVDRDARDMFEKLVKQLAENEGVTEQLKADNQMEWVARMNNVISRVMEIVNSEVIFV